MKWFKHHTDASDDEFIAALEDEFGLEGYARWWKLVEAVGSQMKKGGGPVAAYPWQVWQGKLKGKRNKLETFLVYLENQGRINRKATGNILEIKIPKLLQIKDEYSRKSGHTPDNVPPRSKMEDTEVEIEKEGEVLKDPPPPVKSEKTETPKSVSSADGELKPNGNGNGHHPPEMASGLDTPEGMAQAARKGLVAEFLAYAQKTHLEVRGIPLVLDLPSDAEVVARLVVVVGLSAGVLRRCWDEFVRDLSSDFARSDKPRNLFWFNKRIDYLLERTRAVEQEEARRVQSRGPVIQINPDPEAEALWVECMKYLEGEILPENINTWFTSIFPLVIRRDRVALAVPNRFYQECLQENYVVEIKKALASVGIKPAPKLEFLTQDAYEVVDA